MGFAALADNFDMRMNLTSHILAATLVAGPMLHGEEFVLSEFATRQFEELRSAACHVRDGRDSLREMFSDEVSIS